MAELDTQTTNEQLERLVGAWVDKHTFRHSAASQDRIDELHDHVMCAAEAAVERGELPEDAVRLAVEQFGTTEEVQQQLGLERTAFRRWLLSRQCTLACTTTGRQRQAGDHHLVALSVVVAAALLLTAWLSENPKTYAMLSTFLIGGWVMVAFRMGGTREAARAEWRWLKRKLGY